jgi:hypothetical protein
MKTSNSHKWKKKDILKIRANAIRPLDHVYDQL